MECFYALLLEHSQIMWRYGQTKTYNVKQYCERGVGGGDGDGCSGDGSVVVVVVVVVLVMEGGGREGPCGDSGE